MDSEEFGTLVIWLCAIGVFVWFVWLDDSKLRYEVQYDAEVTIENKPHDCKFLTAPMGRKNCSYEKEVSIILFGKGVRTGEPIISYDEGETWRLNKGGPTDGGAVRVYWVRTEN